MQKLIAINVAIIPPKEIEDWVVGLNNKLWQSNTFGYKMDKTHLPHISLAQLFIRTGDIGAVNSALAWVVEKQHSIGLKGEVKNGQILGKFKYIEIAISQNEALTKLHTEIIEGLRKYKINVGNTNSFYQTAGEEIREFSVQWVTDYYTKGGMENFDPHITVFVGGQTDEQKKWTFTAQRLVNCHLGNFNSCRKILAEWRLK